MCTLPFHKNLCGRSLDAQSVEHTQSVYVLKVGGVQCARARVCAWIIKVGDQPDTNLYLLLPQDPATAVRVICCVMTNHGDGIYAYMAGQYLRASRPVHARARVRTQFTTY